MKTHDFYYELPPELIAQTPLQKRDSSRLLVLGRESGQIEHRHFFDVIDYLKPGDTLVLNDSRVLPARLMGHRVPSGGAVEVLLLKDTGGDVWECLTRPGRKTPVGTQLCFGDGQLTAADSVVTVRDASDLTIYFVNETSFNGADHHPVEAGAPYLERATDEIWHLVNYSYDQLLNRHVADYDHYFNRV
ncbi:MAG: S-adenosylmethionine:tRNA ribosyltransferase-isomerase, partial [Candidatus Faecousia sp.]|nr:S-adenosylmethionine:tRNA ribosyltransferase-isomerase [Candidatus Faecousia sp.]